MLSQDDFEYRYVFHPDSDDIYRSSDGTILADLLSILDIIIVDDCKFCRVKRDVSINGNLYTQTIEYRAYSSQSIRVNITFTKFI